MAIEPNKVVSSEMIYADGRVVNLRIDEVIIKDGTTAFREVVEHRPCAVIVPYLERTDEILMIEQYRDAVRRPMLEVPAGINKNKLNESMEITAKRELMEETGYEAGKLDRIGIYYTSPGFTNEQHHLYLARQLIMRSNTPPDGLEIARCLPVKRREVMRLIEVGDVTDGKTILALLWTARYIKRAL